jgi:hypothetical protein
LLACGLVFAAGSAFAIDGKTLSDMDLEPGAPVLEAVPQAITPPVVNAANTIYLDMDTPATGSNLETTPLVTAYGTITFLGEVTTSTGDIDMPPAGAVGDGLDIENNTNTATLSFDFDVSSITFIYGGNDGVADFTARDIGGNAVATFYQGDTGVGQPVGPITLSGSGIRSLYWQDPGLNYLVIDNVTIEVQMPPFALDIKPTSCPNPLNPKSQGVLPVAILGLGDTDVNDIDVSTVLLEGVAPLRSHVNDVAGPYEGELCGCTTDGPDGFDDLTLKFATQDIVAAVGPVVPGDEIALTLTGQLVDGREFELSDCMVIVGPRKDLRQDTIAGRQNADWSNVKKLYK